MRISNGLSTFEYTNKQTIEIMKNLLITYRADKSFFNLLISVAVVAVIIITAVIIIGDLTPYVR